MESDAPTAQMTLAALAIFCAIPVVSFALWADYFERYVKGLQERKEEFSLEDETNRLRLVGFFAALFQLMLFLGSSAIRKEHPLLVNIIFITAIVVQGLIQASTETNVRPSIAQEARVPSSRTNVFAAAKGIAWIFAATVAYFLILIGSVRFSVWLAQFIQLDKTATTLLVICGAITGLILGLGFNFLISPLHLKNIFPVKPLSEAETLFVRLVSCFRGAKLKQPRVYIIESGVKSAGSAFLAGTKWGFGPFRQTLFISRSLVSLLTEKEMDAVIAHEVSHICLNHLRKRFTLSSVLIVATTFIGVLFVVFSQVISGGGYFWIGPIVALSAFLFSFKLLGMQGQRQELEADLFAVLRLGVDVESFATALNKLDRLNGIQPEVGSNSYPATEYRIRRVRDAIRFRKELREAVEKSDRAA